MIAEGALRREKSEKALQTKMIISMEGQQLDDVMLRRIDGSAIEFALFALPELYRALGYAELALRCSFNHHPIYTKNPTDKHLLYFSANV